MNELPPGWTTSPLENLVDILDFRRVPLNAGERERRIAGKRQDELYPYYGATGLVGHIDDYLFDEPLVLLGEDGVPFLDPLRVKAYQVSEKCWVNNHAHVLRARRQVIDQRYISAFLNSFDYTGYVSGSTRLKLTQESMRSIPILLAPFAEQQRIAGKLDALLARVDACRARLEQVPGILKRFRQAVLAAATSGRLTEDWREEHGQSAIDWRDTLLGELIEKIEAGINCQCDERPPESNERGLVKISAVTWGKYDDEESKTLPQGRYVPESTRIREGDFLISRANTLELVGACVIVDRVRRPVFLSDKILRIVMSEDMKKWLLFWLRSQTGRFEIESRASGNQLSMRNISQANLKLIRVAVPNSEERDEVVRRVETLFAYADRLEARYAVARAQVDRLTASLLAKAFRGELVPQDPADEPAEVLLARVRDQGLQRIQKATDCLAA